MSSAKQQLYHNVWLPFFRISVPLLCLLELLSYQGDFKIFFSSKPIIHNALIASAADQLSITLPEAFIWVKQHLAAQMSYDRFICWVCWLYGIALVLVTVGLVTRLSALLALFLQLMIFRTFQDIQYGFDFFVTLSLFYILIFPCGKYFSLDARWQLHHRIISERTSLLVLQIHICIMYFFFGFDKLIGVNWRNGESMWRVLTEYNLTTVRFECLADTPVFLISGWATVLVEMCYPLFMNLSGTRRFWLMAVLLLHVLIGLIIGLYFFSLIMIILNLTAYYYPYVNKHTAG